MRKSHVFIFCFTVLAWMFLPLCVQAKPDHPKPGLHVKNRSKEPVRWFATWKQDVKTGEVYYGHYAATCKAWPGQSCDLATMTDCYDISAASIANKIIATRKHICTSYENSPILLDFHDGDIVNNVEQE